MRALFLSHTVMRLVSLLYCLSKWIYDVYESEMVFFFSLEICLLMCKLVVIINYSSQMCTLCMVLVPMTMKKMVSHNWFLISESFTLINFLWTKLGRHNGLRTWQLSVSSVIRQFLNLLNDEPNHTKKTFWIGTTFHLSLKTSMNRGFELICSQILP